MMKCRRWTRGERVSRGLRENDSHHATAGFVAVGFPAKIATPFAGPRDAWNQAFTDNQLNPEAV